MEGAVGFDGNVAHPAFEGSSVQHLRLRLGKGKIRAEEDAAFRRGHYHIRRRSHAYRVGCGATARVYTQVARRNDAGVAGNNGLCIGGDDVARQRDVEFGEAALVIAVDIDECIAHQARARAGADLHLAAERHSGLHIAHAEGERDEREQIGGIKLVAGAGEGVDKALFRRDIAEDIDGR